MANSAAQRLLQAFRPATQKTYLCMFGAFCGFFVAAGLHLSQVSHVIQLAFMEFLLQNNITPANIANYMAGLWASFILYGLDTTTFQNQQLQYFQKATRLQVQTFPKTITVLEENILLRIMLACDSMQFSETYKPLYLLAFFTLIHMSNMLPHTVSYFNPTRQLTISDVLFSHQATTITIKWSKTLQDKSTFMLLHSPIWVHQFCVSFKQSVIS